MAISILTKPISYLGPAGQPWSWQLHSGNTNQPKFKYVVDVFIFNTFPNLLNPSVRLKVSANLFQRGNVDISHILQQFLKSDPISSLNSAPQGATFKGVDMSWAGSNYRMMPIHLVDLFSCSSYSLRKFRVRFGEEYAPSATAPSVVYPNLAEDGDYACFNGVVMNGARWGEDGSHNTGGVQLTISNPLHAAYGGPYICNSVLGRFLTNAPYTQYVNDGDYMTVGFLAGHFKSTSTATWDRMRITIGGSTIYIEATGNNGYDGSSDTTLAYGYQMLQFFGCGPGNLVQDSTFNTQYVTNGIKDYEIALSDGSSDKSAIYYFKHRGDDCKGYESIRLCWLNRHGTWDYYNFTKKSYRKLDIDREYTQKRKGQTLIWTTRMGSSRVNGTYSVRAKETITANTDWVTDEEAVWLEELFTSPQVFMLKGLDTLDVGTDGPDSQLDYVRPVQLVNKSYERYTSANDKVAQYEIELEVDDIVNVQAGQTNLITIG